MQSTLKRLPIGSLIAFGILGLAVLGQIAALAIGTMPAKLGYGFAGFAFSGATALLAAHQDSSRSRRLRLAESTIGSIAGAAFFFVAVYSIFEKV